MSKRLCFVLKSSEGMFKVMARFNPNGKSVLNRTEWMGKEPRSCAVTLVKSRPHSAGDKSPATFDIEVSYRPKGYISYNGNVRYDGWTLMVLDQEADPPAYVPHEVYEDIEFNDLDFGEFDGEFDVQAVEHLTVDAAMKEIMESSSVQGSFIAPHRSRPLKKIVLSSNPTGVQRDGFGTLISNINNKTPNLEQFLMEEIGNLMCEFIEGRVMIDCMENDNLTFVEISKSLVDCAPNEDGLDSFFDILHLHTPTDFLEDLAKRLMSVYAIQVAVVDGEKGGLMLRREVEKA